MALAAWSSSAGAQDPGRSLPNARSGEPTWVHESWTTKDGLPVNSINALIQDRVGYIWAATFDGLVRFDGVRFTVFNSANTDGLPSSRFVAVTEGSDGTLWLATEAHGIVRFHDGRFTSVPFDQLRPQERYEKHIVDTAGRLWVGTTKGLWTLDGNRFVSVARDEIRSHVTALLQRRDGSIWVGTRSGGVFRVGNDGVATRARGDSAIGTDSIHVMYEDRSGVLWLGGGATLYAWRERAVPIPAPEALYIQTIVQVSSTGELFVDARPGLYKLNAGRLQVVRGRVPSIDGVRLWSDGGAVWSATEQDIYRDGRLVVGHDGPRIIRSVLFDREGSIWLGDDGGIHRLTRGLFTAYDVPPHVVYPAVYPTYVSRAGHVFAGTWGWGAFRIDPVSGHVSVFEKQLPDAINAFLEDASGRLWVGTGFDRSAGGVYVCSPPGMACRPDGSPQLRRTAVFALHVDGTGILWAGAVDGLYRYDGTTWIHIPRPPGAPDVAVRAFASTRDGALWMGMNGGGLARYHHGRFTLVRQSDGLPSDLIRALYEDADGWLWVGTEGRGLVRLDPRAWGDGQTKRSIAARLVGIRMKEGLFDETIHQILEDDAGRLWMNTNRGIFWVPRAELNAFAEGRATVVHSVSYTERDGMRNREGNGGVQPAGAKGPDGRLWFPTQNGVVVVDPATVENDRRPPPLVVEQVVATGLGLRPQRDSITLGRTQRDVQIEYTALTFRQPANVRFRYRLEGYDTDWVDAGNRRTAFYTKLPPARYTFRVEASDVSGGWHEPGATLALRVLPQVWETSLFRGALIVTLGALLVLASRLREARLRERAVELARVVDQRTAALRERERELAERNVELQQLDRAKTHFFANVSHELRTPLTLTIGPLEDLRARAGGNSQEERWLDVALRNSRRLLRLVNQILDVAKLEAGAMRLTPRRLDLAPFTRGVVAAFSPVAERKGIRLTAETAGDLVGGFDSDAIEKVLTNLLSNAIKFTPTGGTVDLLLTREPNAVRLVVRDSGPGIPTEQLQYVFERFYQVDESTTRTQPGTGIGLSLVKELVELHGGTVSAATSPAGTTLTAVIPLLAVEGERLAPDEARAVREPVFASVTAEHDQASVDVPIDDADGPSDDVPTLLVVDDSTDLRHYIRDHFASHFRVLEAADGVAGVDAARRELPDVILSDVMMPGLDGHGLVRALRASPETDFLAIVLLTARAGDEERLDGLERGADDYLVKPFSMRELDVRVRNLIAARRRLRDRFASPPVPVTPIVHPDLSDDDRAYVTRVRAAIQRGLGDPEFGVGELADALSQDRSRVFRRIRDLLDEPPSLLIRRMRLEEGARLLREGGATVSDVAYAVGFNSVSYFCRCFQEAYGATPAAYRRRAG